MAIDTDDLAPPPKAARLDLDVLSIEALTLRIAALEDEIQAIRVLIDKKKASRGAADAIFSR